MREQCKASTKAGTPCRAAATAGGFCFFHANPNKASELGRIGGRKNGRGAAAVATDPLPRLNTAMAVRDTVARFIDEVYSGKLDPRIASGLAPLLNLQLRIIDTADLEHRIMMLEKHWEFKRTDQQPSTAGIQHRQFPESSEPSTNLKQNSETNGKTQ